MLNVITDYYTLTPSPEYEVNITDSRPGVGGGGWLGVGRVRQVVYSSFVIKPLLEPQQRSVKMNVGRTSIQQQQHQTAVKT